MRFARPRKNIWLSKTASCSTLSQHPKQTKQSNNTFKLKQDRCSLNMTQQDDLQRSPPAPLPSRPIQIPTPYQTTLSNGLALVIVEDRRLPLVSYRLAFRAGDAQDPKELPGLTDLMTSLLNEGTESR